MLARDYWKTVTVDLSDLLDRLLARLREHQVPFCVIGGQAVNAYAEPVVSLDVDLVIAAEAIATAVGIFEREFHVERFEHSVNVSAEGSDLRVQIQTDRRYTDFVQRAGERDGETEDQGGQEQAHAPDAPAAEMALGNRRPATHTTRPVRNPAPGIAFTRHPPC